MNNRGFISFFILVALLAFFLWFGINHFVIPRVVIPAVRKEIGIFNQTSPLTLTIQNIHFDLLQGFHFKGIKIAGKGKAIQLNLAQAETADIDLDYLALLHGRVVIKDINVSHAQLNLLRGKNEDWNFAPLLKYNFMKKEKGTAEPSFVIKQVSFKSGAVLYSDHFDHKNSLERNYQAIDLAIFDAPGKKYQLVLSGKDEKHAEWLFLKMGYDADTFSAEGKAEFVSPRIADYWNYYLDDLFQPWKIQAQKVIAKVAFAYEKGELSLTGQYKVEKGEVAFGKLKIKGNAQIKHEQTYSFKKHLSSCLQASAELENLVGQAEKNQLFYKAQAKLLVNKKEMILKDFSGMTGSYPFSLGGRFIFNSPRQLLLQGSIGKTKNVCNLRLATENQAVLNWSISSEAVNLKLYADLSDLKNMLFGSNVVGTVALVHLPSHILVDVKGKTVSVEAGEDPFKGEVALSGEIRGRIGDLNSLHGRLALKFTDFSVMSFPPVSFFLDMRLEEGLFSAGIPETQYFGGGLSGSVLADMQRWGVSLRVNQSDVAALGKVDPRFSGLKGIVTANFAGASDWGSIEAVRGGGYVNIINCDLRNAPLFTAAAKGIESVTHGFVMPEFKRIEGNFNIADQQVVVENVFCAADYVNLAISGKQFFNGSSDFTLGVKFFKQRAWGAGRLLLLPVTMGIDILADAIKVHLIGVWPDLKATASIQPMAWFNAAFSAKVKSDPDRYTLDQFW